MEYGKPPTKTDGSEIASDGSSTVVAVSLAFCNDGSWPAKSGGNPDGGTSMIAVHCQSADCRGEDGHSLPLACVIFRRMPPNVCAQAVSPVKGATVRRRRQKTVTGYPSINSHK